MSLGDSQKTTQTSSFPSFIEPPANRLTNRLLNQTGTNISPNAQGLLDSILGGDFLAGGPSFNLLLDQAQNEILPRVNSTFALAGRGRSGLAGQAAAQGLGTAFGNLVASERARQIAALPFAFRQAETPFSQNLGVLQALLQSPTNTTQTASSRPGALSFLGAGLGGLGAFGAGGLF